jgi:bacillithiol biosynthesis cysteine-adding enzyme BshC
MKSHCIPYKQTHFFSKLIVDYVEKDEGLKQFYSNFPDSEGFKNQIENKLNFPSKSRAILSSELQNQYNGLEINNAVFKNIESLKNENTFTVTTGHQLNIFTGPLYFLYKIIATINLANELKANFPDYNFVPIYWMATEDHDFDEINYFNFLGNKISWDRESSGAVGRLNTTSLTDVFDQFSKLLGNSKNSLYLKELFKKAYLNQNSLAKATRFLVNELFGEYGLVIIDGDSKLLKTLFIPIVKDELLNNTGYKKVLETGEKLGSTYHTQVNPREINLFYLKDSIRERLIFSKNKFKVNNTALEFSQDEILAELYNHPDRFSPNVLLRPVFQEVILPNLCYIGGGGELAYWLQLKKYFETIKIPFPVLLLRNSVHFINAKQMEKLNKLNLTLAEMFLPPQQLVNQKVKEWSSFEIDFSKQKLYLNQQFKELKELALQTDKSFLGAVNAQERKQIKGLENLEKRLLKAQKRNLSEKVERILNLRNEVFKNGSLQERHSNFADLYIEFGPNLILELFQQIKPLNLNFTVIEY